MKNKRKKQLIAIIISLIVAAVVMEGTLRVISNGMYLERSTIQLNPFYGYQNIPDIEALLRLEDGTLNVLKTNSYGFAGKEYSIEKPEGMTRILVLGDSFVEGKSVHANNLFTRFLEDSLNSHNESFEVIPRGTSSWATENQFLYLKSEGLKYNPNMVVIAFFANDVGYNFNTKLLTLDLDGSLKNNTPFNFSSFQKFQVWCRSISELCGFVRYKIYPLISTDQESDSHGDLYWGILRDLVVEETSEQTSMSLAETKEILREFVALSEQEGFRPILMIIPFKEQVDPESMRETFSEKKIESETDLKKLNRFLAESGEEIGLEVFDPTDFLAERNSENKVFYEIDSHLNTNGNKQLAIYMKENIFV